MLNSNTGIEYVDIPEPTEDFLVSGKPMSKPVATVVSGGSLPAGIYSYAIYAQDSAGYTRPANYVTVTVSTNGSSVTLTWDPYPHATNYFVVGRYGAQGVIGSTASTMFTDTGVTAPSTNPLPTLASYPVMYNTIGSITISSKYSDRGV